MAPAEEALTERTQMRASVRSDGLCPTDGTFAGRSGGLPRKRAERLRGHKGAADAADECVPKGDAKAKVRHGEDVYNFCVHRAVVSCIGSIPLSL